MTKCSVILPTMELVIHRPRFFFPILFFLVLILEQTTYSQMQPEYSLKDKPPEELDIKSETNTSSSAVSKERIFQPIPSDKNTKRAEKLLAVGQTNDAIAVLEQIVDANPALLRAWELLGQTYWKAKEQDKAIQLWKNLCFIMPDTLFPYNELGDAYRSRNELEKAVIAYQRSLKINPGQLSVQLNLGRSLRWTGRLDDAIQTLRKLCHEKPDWNDAKAELARALLSNRQYQEALPLWTELIKSGSTDTGFLTRETIALFHTDHYREAMEQAQKLVMENPDNVEILTMLVDASEFTGNLRDAIAYLTQILRISEANSQRARRTLFRLTRLYDREYEADPQPFHLEPLFILLRNYLEANPLDVDIWLSFGEFQTRIRQFKDAETSYTHVLQKLNPHNIRAHRGLFEVALGQGKYRKAQAELEEIRAFNPKDPCLYYIEARLKADKGNYTAAFESLDKLEAAGLKGSVAVLLYHGLSTSDSSEVMPVNLFREQLITLRKAGFKFVSPNELADYFNRRNRLTNEKLPDTDIELMVMVTFDDARRDSMRLATPVARELGLVFSMHVPVGYVERSHAFICTWDMLHDFEQSGCWCFGGHTMNAHDRAPIDAEGHLVFALANRLWLPDANRQETESEYLARLHVEYAETQRRLEQHLPSASVCPFVAYPFGDIGQQTCGNFDKAISANLAEAGRVNRMGFIQSALGYAINGDNPLLYQRMEPQYWETGSNVLTHLLENHPVFVARRSRAEYAALSGKRYLAEKMLISLQQDGYPKDSLAKLKDRVEDKLGRKISFRLEDCPSVRTTNKTARIVLPTITAETGQLPAAPKAPDPDAKPRPRWSHDYPEPVNRFEMLRELNTMK